MGTPKRNTADSDRGLTSDDDSSSSPSDEDIAPKITTKRVTKKSVVPVVQVSKNEANATRISISSNNKRKRIVGVIVEDASDSEYEDDEYKSPWRNRRPSPGEWLEPVENFIA